MDRVDVNSQHMKRLAAAAAVAFVLSVASAHGQGGSGSTTPRTDAQIKQMTQAVADQVQNLICPSGPNNGGNYNGNLNIEVGSHQRYLGQMLPEQAADGSYSSTTLDPQGGVPSNDVQWTLNVYPDNIKFDRPGGKTVDLRSATDGEAEGALISLVYHEMLHKCLNHGPGGDNGDSVRGWQDCDHVLIYMMQIRINCTIVGEFNGLIPSGDPAEDARVMEIQKALCAEIAKIRRVYNQNKYKHRAQRCLCSSSSSPSGLRRNWDYAAGGGHGCDCRIAEILEAAFDRPSAALCTYGNLRPNEIANVNPDPNFPEMFPSCPFCPPTPP